MNTQATADFAVPRRARFRARHALRWTAVLTVLAGLLFGVLPAPKSMADDGNSYTSPIANWHSLLCLSVPGASKYPTVDLNQYYCGKNNDYNPVYPDQTWTLDQQGTDSRGNLEYVIINDNSKLCMSVPGASTKAATVVNQYPCGYYPDQYWAVISVWDPFIGSYAWQLKNEHSQLCLSVPGASTAATTVVNQYPCDSSYPDQYWDIGGLDGTST